MMCKCRSNSIFFLVGIVYGENVSTRETWLTLCVVCGWIHCVKEYIMPWKSNSEGPRVESQRSLWGKYVTTLEISWGYLGGGSMVRPCVCCNAIVSVTIIVHFLFFFAVHMNYCDQLFNLVVLHNKLKLWLHQQSYNTVHLCIGVVWYNLHIYLMVLSFPFQEQFAITSGIMQRGADIRAR